MAFPIASIVKYPQILTLPFQLICTNYFLISREEKEYAQICLASLLVDVPLEVIVKVKLTMELLHVDRVLDTKIKILNVFVIIVQVTLYMDRW